MKLTPLRSKDFSKEANFEVSKKDVVELMDDKVVFINKKPSFFYHEGKLIPTLKLLQEHELLKKVVVDMGAVKFIVSGADVMRPGIREIDGEIKKDDAVVVVDMNNRKPLAVCVAMYDSEKMREMSSGKVLKNIHYVGDELWKL
jgi:PUA domain protein